MKKLYYSLAGIFYGITAGLIILCIAYLFLGRHFSLPLVIAFATFAVSFFFLVAGFLTGGRK